MSHKKSTNFIAHSIYELEMMVIDDIKNGFVQIDESTFIPVFPRHRAEIARYFGVHPDDRKHAQIN